MPKKATLKWAIMIKKFLYTLWIISLTTHFALANKPNQWTGTFEFYNRVGFDGGGTAATGSPVSYDLVLKLGGNGSCQLNATGYATDETVNCRIAALPDGGIDVQFAGTPPGASEVGPDGVGDDRVGGVLFSFAPKDGNKAFITFWRHWKPVVVDKPSGNYFVKISMP
jgi:hypothetical protein